MNTVPHIISRIIMRAEAIFRTDLRYVFHGLSWSLIGQIAAVISSLALSVVLGHALSKETYGVYKYVLSFVALLSVFSLNNIRGAVFQSTARGFDGALKEGFMANLRWSILIFAGACAIGAYYFFAHNFELAYAILLGGCISPFIVSANTFGSFLSAKKDFARHTLYVDVFGNSIPVILLIVTAYVSPHVVSLVTVYFLSNAAVDLYFYLRTKKIYAVDDTATDPHMLTYGKYLSILGVLTGIAGNIDKLLLFHYVAAAQLAVYAFAIGIFDQVKGPVKTLDIMMQARFVTRKDNDLQRSMPYKILWIFLFSLVAIFVFVITAPLLYKILFPAYTEAIPYAQVYAFSLLGTCMYPITSYIISKKRLREHYILIISSSVIQIVMIFIGIFGWGLWGLVIARVASSITTALLTVLVYLLLVRERAKT